VLGPWIKTQAGKIISMWEEVKKGNRDEN